MFDNNYNIFDNSNFNSNNDSSSINNNDVQNIDIAPKESSDMPPELGEIKGLNDATKVNAPTLDVLGPMNLMPEHEIEPQDALAQYENGLPNVFEIPNLDNSQNDSINENQFSSFFNRTLEEPKEDINIPLASTEEENNYEIVNDVKINDEVIPSLNELEENENKEEKDIESKDDIVIEKNNDDNNEEELNEIKDDEIELTEDVITEEENIEENKVINDDIKEELVSNKILKIREYINSLNLNVKIEEYDFEELYQLIIKIKK